MNESEEILKVKDVAKLLKVSSPWVYKAAGQGLIPHIKYPCLVNNGKRSKEPLRFKKSEVWKFIERYTQDAHS